MPIELSGMDELLARLARTNTNVEAAKRKALMAGAEIIRKEIEARAPVDTGFLKARIVISEKAGVSYVDVGPSEAVYYAKMLEFGTKKMKAQPFIEPAFLDRRRESITAMRDVIRGAIGSD